MHAFKICWPGVDFRDRTSFGLRQLFTLGNAQFTSSFRVFPSLQQFGARKQRASGVSSAAELLAPLHSPPPRDLQPPLVPIYFSSTSVAGGRACI